MPSEQRQTERGNRTGELVRVKLPRMWNVFIINDDVTTFEFVEFVLVTLFDKDPGTAEAIALAVHNSGKGLVGRYSFDIAHTRVEKATGLARDAGFPLEFTIEPEQTDNGRQ